MITAAYLPWNWDQAFKDRRPLGQLIEEGLDDARRELFQVRLEKEAAISTEDKLVIRIARLEAEEKAYAAQRAAKREQSKSETVETFYGSRPQPVTNSSIQDQHSRPPLGPGNET